jgi:hypothetical protein
MAEIYDYHVRTAEDTTLWSNILATLFVKSSIFNMINIPDLRLPPCHPPATLNTASSLLSPSSSFSLSLMASSWSSNDAFALSVTLQLASELGLKSMQITLLGIAVARNRVTIARPRAPHPP